MKNIKNNQKGFVVQGVIALIALVLISVGAYYVGTKKVDAPEVEDVSYDNNEFDVKPGPDDYNLTHIDSIADWKTSTDRISGMTYMYPSTWHKLNGPGCADAFGPENNNYYITVCGPGYSGDAITGNDKLISKENVMVSGYSSVRQEVIRTNNQYKIEITIKDIKYDAIESNQTVSKTGDWTIYFVISRDADITMAKKELEAILSTFKFTSQNTSSTQPSIKILSPNGREVLTIGKEHAIKWSSDVDISKVVIYAVSPTDTGFGTNISGDISVRASGIDGSHSFAWKIGNIYQIKDDNGKVVSQYPIKPGKYKIEICRTDKMVHCDESDNQFTITN